MLQQAPVLSHPDLTHPFSVATDASNVGIGCVLFQVIDNQYCYIGFMARALSKLERNYSTTKRELLGIVYALRKFHQFLWGRKFTLYTDHKALTYIHTQSIANPMMVRWLDILCDYTYDIVHLPGVHNVLPDSLSRLFPTAKELEGGNAVQTSLSHSDSRPAVTQGAAPPFPNQMHTPAQRMLKPVDLMTPPDEERTELLEKAHLLGHFGADAIV